MCAQVDTIEHLHIGIKAILRECRLLGNIKGVPRILPLLCCAQTLQDRLSPQEVARLLRNLTQLIAEVVDCLALP
jgi:hypothetical protein